MPNITSTLSMQMLNFLSAKHNVISQNIANNNTPGYKAKQLTMPKNFFSLINKMAINNNIQMSTSNSTHLAGYRSGLKYKTKKDMSGTRKINGNNVSLKSQIINMSANQVEYDKAIKSYMNASSLMSVALGNKGQQHIWVFI